MYCCQENTENDILPFVLDQLIVLIRLRQLNIYTYRVKATKHLVSKPLTIKISSCFRFMRRQVMQQPSKLKITVLHSHVCTRCNLQYWFHAFQAHQATDKNEDKMPWTFRNTTTATQSKSPSEHINSIGHNLVVNFTMGYLKGTTLVPFKGKKMGKDGFVFYFTVSDLFRKVMGHFNWSSQRLGAFQVLENRPIHWWIGRVCLLITPNQQSIIMLKVSVHSYNINCRQRWQYHTTCLQVIIHKDLLFF